MTFKDSQEAMRSRIVIEPITDEQRDQCRNVLNAHNATDLAEMLGVTA